MASKTLGDLMTHDVRFLSPGDTVQQAAREMKDLNVGVMPVCEQDRRLVGLVTDRDIVTRVVAEGRPVTEQLRKVITEGPVTGRTDWDVKRAVRLMQDHQIRRLPIVDESNHLIGIVSLGDIAVEQPSDKLTGEALQEISKPARPERPAGSRE